MSGLENNGNPYERIIRLVEGMEEELVAYRRDFHKYPEAGWFEMRTSSLIARRLTEFPRSVSFRSSTTGLSVRARIRSLWSGPGAE